MTIAPPADSDLRRPFSSLQASCAGLALACLALVPAGPASAAPRGYGDVQGDFNPNGGFDVFGTAVQPDGRILVSGDFTTFGGETRNRIVRLNENGTLDASFTPSANESVRSICLQPDGSMVLAGFFTTMNGTTRNRVARIGPSGLLDPGFNPNANHLVGMAVLQPDGKVLLGGFFTTLQPNGAPSATTRNYFARVLADGSLDAGFHPNPNNFVYHASLQTDGKILVGGIFTSLQPNGVGAPVTRNYCARLLADGTVDPSFVDPQVNDLVLSMTPQADGRIIITGFFTSVGGQPRNRIARLNDTGTLDTTFNPNADQRVDTIGLQADGRIILGGDFSTVGGAAHVRLARVESGGAVDAGFVASANAFVLSTVLQADGKILVGGKFTQVDGVNRNYFARLENEPATQSLSVTSGSRVQWLRGGTSPEARSVTFELSTNGGGNYTALGVGTRIAGGWELTGLSLPASGLLRARARLTGGHSLSSTGLAETLLNFAPEVMVSGNNTDIPNNGAAPSPANHTDFGSAYVGTQSVTRTYTIVNTGNAVLSLGSVQLLGVGAGAFSVVQAPAASVAAGGSTTLQILFDPAMQSILGLLPATVRFSTNDADENPFQFAIQGRALSDNSALASLLLNPGTLTPPFQAGTLSYTAAVNYGAQSLLLTASPARPEATMRLRLPSGTYTALPPVNPVSVPLDVGANNLEVEVTAQDGLSITRYTVTVTRAAAVAGSPDLTFDPGANGTVYSVIPQANASILVGGGFGLLGGNPHASLGRVTPTGAVEGTFNPSTNGVTLVLNARADDKIDVAGTFTDLNALAIGHVGRLLVSGQRDNSYAPQVNGTVYAGLLEPDGRFLVGGDFNAVNGGVSSVRGRLAHILPSGFSPNDFGRINDGVVFTVARQPDGRVLVGGGFTSAASGIVLPRANLARFSSTGVLDSFDPAPNGPVRCLAVLPDGSFYVAGLFQTIAGQPRANLARFDANGVLDAGFDVGTNSYIYSLLLQADGHLIIGGAFTTVTTGGVTAPRNRLARLTAAGALDPVFDPDLDSTVFSLAGQADGAVLVGGDFTQVGGVARARLARLQNGPATSPLSAFVVDRIGWMRGGTSPETGRVTFELSTDGGNSFTLLGAGERVPGGWELAGQNLPPDGMLRARAEVVGGVGNGSTGLVETLTTYHALTLLEAWRQQHFGTIANSGNAANDFDFDGDGLPNLLEFAFGTDPTQPASAQLPGLQVSGGNASFSFSTPAGAGGVTYSAEWSTDLLGWTVIPDTGIPPQHTFSTPTGSKKFVRLRVSVP